MASRMLHYTIALELMKHMNIKDKNRFGVGVLLPDASSHKDGSYNSAHFYDEWQMDVLYKGVNWKRFVAKYSDRLWTDDLYLGYLSHLIMDAIWFHDIVYSPSRNDNESKSIDKFIYTSDFPQVDLIIRTGGEFRLSNFLLWQSAYAEFVFMDVLWPDFSKKELWFVTI